MSKWLTPPTIATQLGVRADKVVAWIKRGELVAVNLADNAHGSRPRFRVDPVALEKFLATRSTAKPPAPPPRRRVTLPAQVHQHFKP